METCDNGSRLAWKAGAPLGVGGSSPSVSDNLRSIKYV
jgi:hypothetical protein